LVMLSTQKSYTLLCRAQMEQSKTKYTCFAIKHSKQILYYICLNLPETGIEQNPKVSVVFQKVDGSCRYKTFMFVSKCHVFQWSKSHIKEQNDVIV